MKEQPKPPGRFGSLLSGVPRPAKIAALVVVGLFFLVIIYSVFFAKKTSNSDQMVVVAGRAQEIARVSELVIRNSKDNDGLSLATTMDEAMTSQEVQLRSYLAKQKVKLDPKLLLTYVNKSTDASLAEAQQNNAYEQAYYSYLKDSLTRYQTSLNTAYSAAGPKGKALLSDANESVKTILSASQLK